MAPDKPSSQTTIFHVSMKTYTTKISSIILVSNANKIMEYVFVKT